MSESPKENQGSDNVPNNVTAEPNPFSSQRTMKQYFDEKLHPHLSAALTACARARPDDPVTFVGNYLLDLSKASGQ